MLFSHNPIVFDAGGGGSVQHISTSSGSDSTDNMTIPANNSGDVVLLYAVRSTGGGAMSTTLSGWTLAQNSDSGANGQVTVFYRTDAPSGTVTVTNSDRLFSGVYRPTAGTLSIGDTAENSGTSGVANIPALTLQNTDGSSLVAAVLFHRGSTLAQIDITDAGGNLLTERDEQLVAAASRSAAIGDTNSGVASYPLQSTITDDDTSIFCTVSIEVKIS